MFSQTITIFNRREGDKGDTWYPTVLNNAKVDMDRAAILAKYGATATDNAAIHIPYTKDENGAILIAGKRWLPPQEWEAQLEHSECITFTPGDRFDFFWLGDWGNENPVYDGDYAPSYMDFYTHMNRVHDFVFAVSSVGGPYRIIPHFEIMGK